MTSEGLGEMFEGDSADMCARKFCIPYADLLLNGVLFGVQFSYFM